MSLRDQQLYIIPSLFDRLSDDDPSSQRENLEGLSIEQLKKVIVEDLVALFNSRATPKWGVDKKSELYSSIYYYGLPDFTTLNPESSESIKIIAKAMEKAIEYYEPRLINAKVKLLSKTVNFKAMDFRIDADLRLDPEPMPIQVDTSLDASTCVFK